MRHMRQAAPILEIAGPHGVPCRLHAPSRAPRLGAGGARPLPALAPAPDDALTAALETGELTEAEYALERARERLPARAVRDEFGDVERAGRRDATLSSATWPSRGRPRRRRAPPAKRSWPGPDGAAASRSERLDSPESLFSPTCSAIPGVELCVHWVDFPGDPDARPTACGRPVDGRPRLGADLATLGERLVPGDRRARLPRPARTSPRPTTAPTRGSTSTSTTSGRRRLRLLHQRRPEPRLHESSPSPPTASSTTTTRRSSSGRAHTPQEFLEVTAAHEFHHASQFAYDWLGGLLAHRGHRHEHRGDGLPGDRRQRHVPPLLEPAHAPASPLDRGGFGDSEYGAWIFWRFLEEKVAGRPGHPARRSGSAPTRTTRPRRAARRLLAPGRAPGAHRARPRLRGRVRALRGGQPARRLRRRQDCRLPRPPLTTDVHGRPERTRSSAGAPGGSTTSRRATSPSSRAERAAGREARVVRRGCRSTVPAPPSSSSTRNGSTSTAGSSGTPRATRAAACASGAASSSASRSSSRTGAREWRSASRGRGRRPTRASDARSTTSRSSSSAAALRP